MPDTYLIYMLSTIGTGMIGWLVFMEKRGQDMNTRLSVAEQRLNDRVVSEAEARAELHEDNRKLEAKLVRLEDKLDVIMERLLDRGPNGS